MCVNEPDFGAEGDGANESESETRAPIHWEWNPYNWLLQMFGTTVEDPEAFETFLQSLQEHPPEVMAGGWVAVVPFDWGYRGALMAKFDPVLGNSTSETADPATGWGRLPPAQLADRIAKIERYTDALHSLGMVKRVMPYIDFGTQLFGRHNRPLDAPESVWGFWEFYDHWEEYAEPTGEFGLGPKPPDPTTWLAEWHNPNERQPAWNSPPSPLPDELKGLSFSYSPIKPSVYGPTYRYSVCLNTQGWALWWKQVIQWVARVGYDGVFLDNAYMTLCWNQECQEGYQEWLQENFTPEEIRRYFTTTTNNLLTDPSIEIAWHQVSGQWGTPNWSQPSLQTNSIFPDTDAYGGRYSCRIEGPDGNDVAVFKHITQFVPTDLDLQLSFYYKTEGVVQAKMIIVWVDLPEEPKIEKVLNLVDGWIKTIVDFHTPTGEAKFFLRFEVTGTGRVWLDEFWLGEISPPPEFKVELWKPSEDPIRLWAAKTYWSQVADEKLGYLRNQARQVNPKFELFTNGFHAVNADYFMSEGLAIELEDSRYDVGFFPGVYLPYDPPVKIQGSKNTPLELTEPLVVTNVFDYKYIHSQRMPGFFGYHMPKWFYAAGKGFYDHNPDSTLLNLAEAAAFGGGAGCDAAHLRHNYFRYTSQEAANIREVEKQFWKFIQGHKHLYSGYRIHADVVIVFHDLPKNGPMYDEFHQIMDLAKGLAGRGVLWDVLTENRCKKESFARLPVLIYQDVPRISGAEAEAVLEFIGQGGLVIAAATVGDNDEWFRMRLSDSVPGWPPAGLPPTDANGTRARPPAFQQHGGAGTLIYQPDPLTADQVIAAMETHLGRTVQMIGNVPTAAAERLRVNAWYREDGGGTISLHVVNYNVPLGKDMGNQVQPLSNVHVSVPVLPQMKVNFVRLFSPESNDPPQVVPFTVANGLVTFEIPSLRIYTMAVIE